MSTANSTAFDAIGDENFISLTTFRKNGEGVATTVWVGRDGDDLIVRTQNSTGKVKRIRNIARVEMRASSRMGKVSDDAPTVVGAAHIDDSDDARSLQDEVFREKYGLQYKAFSFIEHRGKSNGEGRVIIRIRPEEPETA